MSNSTPERIVERLKKLLRLSKDGAAKEGEIENALKCARTLMDEYGLSEQSVLLDETVEETSRRIVEQDIYTLRIFKPYYMTLATVVCVVCSCSHYYGHEYDKKTFKEKKKLIFFGQEGDVHIAKALYKELCVTLRTMAYFHYGKQWSSQHNAYANGFSDSLFGKAYEIKDTSTNDPSTTALVVQKDAAIEKYKEGLGLVPMKSRVSQINDDGAYHNGNEDGKNVSLDTSGIGQGTKRKKKLLLT